MSLVLLLFTFQSENRARIWGLISSLPSCVTQPQILAHIPEALRTRCRWQSVYLFTEVEKMKGRLKDSTSMEAVVLSQIAGPWFVPPITYYCCCQLRILRAYPKLHIGHVFFLQSHQHLSEGGSVVWMQLTSNLSLQEKLHHRGSSGHQSPDFNQSQDSRSQDLPAPIKSSFLESHSHFSPLMIIFLNVCLRSSWFESGPQTRDLYSLEEKSLWFLITNPFSPHLRSVIKHQLETSF